jgi:limonene-1,2-epoxide hydrolase
MSGRYDRPGREPIRPPPTLIGGNVWDVLGRLDRVTLSHQQIFERYIYAGAITRDPDAIAGLFTEDGVYEAPLGQGLPRRLAGREAIRAGISAYHESSPADGTVNTELSKYVLHDTADPDVFIAEIDAVSDTAAGRRTMSLVQIFRVHDDRIVSLRDYFTTAFPD